MAEPLLCAGGPLDGQTIVVRTDPFLAANREAGLAWLYRREGSTARVVTDHDNSLIYPDGPTTGVRALDAVRLWQAGENSVLHIIAVSDD
jgi:hypothetical protein